MRWPYSARVDAAHAWGTVGAGIAIGGIIVGALATIHGNDPHFRWWWPTNWLAIPIGIVIIGVIMIVVPLCRRDEQSNEEPAQPQIPQSFVQNITASSPGATAQGAAIGDVINYPKQPGNGSADPAATESEERPP